MKIVDVECKITSPPVRGRGLKLVELGDALVEPRRPPCGGAD